VSGLRRALTGAAVGVLVGCAGGAPRGTPGVAPAPVIKMLFPLVLDSVRFASGWGDERENGRSHHGQDLFCPKWTPILAVVSGTVDWISTSRPKPPKGYHLLLRGEDGNLYLYEHLNDDDPGTGDDAGPPRYAYARGLKNGDHVDAGDIVGYVGDSGNAEKWGAHLHFEIHVGKWGNSVDPAPSLRAALAQRHEH
jgi:murein DD-endopeptidase MepM/ murein hydrolase activator NlpD